MKVKDAKTIQLTYEQIDVIVLGELKAIYEQQLAEIDSFNSFSTPKEYQLDDNAYCKEIRDAARVLIEYHMPVVEATEYFLSLKKTPVTNTSDQRTRERDY